MRTLRIIGVVLALAALGGGFLAASKATATAREAARADASAQAQRVASEVLEAVKALPAQLMPISQSAAASKPLKALIASAPNVETFDDFMRTEGGWETYRAVGSTGLFFGGDLQAFTVPLDDQGARVDLAAATQLARDAQAGGSASGFLPASERLVMASAAKSDSTPNGRTVSVVIARRVKQSDLEPLAEKLAVALSLSGPKGEPLTAGSAALAAKLGSTDEGAVSKELSPGVTLRSVADVSGTVAKADANAVASRTMAWVISGLLAAAALAFAFWPRPQTALLQETTAELARSREELVRLSGKFPSSQLLEGAPAPLQLKDELNSTSISQAPTSGRYEILGQLGEGGMAKVYVAVSRGAEGFQRSFVIKRLRSELTTNSEAVNQFIDEGRLGASLVHSNIVPVLDFGRDNDGYYLAQEYILGRSIDRLVEVSMSQLQQPLSPRMVLYLAQEALKALGYAHSKHDDRGNPMGLVHRDVSPSNLMVSERGELKLLDFGIVKSEKRLTKTQTGMVKGNLFFMSPEQAKGLVVDARSDLFSLGMVLLTASLGSTLYTGTTSYELLNRAGAGLTDEDLVRVRAMTLGPLMEKALRQNPDERYSSADEFAKAVAAVGTPATAGEVGALVQQLFGVELANETAAFRRARGDA